MKVVVLSPARWSAARRLPQFIAGALALLGHEVLYVDPPVSVLSPLRDRARLQDLRGPRSERGPDGLAVWHPVVLPGQNARIGQAANAAMLERGIRRRMADPDVVVAFALEARGVLRR